MYSPRKRALPAPPPVRFPKRKPLFYGEHITSDEEPQKGGCTPSVRFYDRPLDAQSGNALHPSRGENRKNGKEKDGKRRITSACNKQNKGNRAI